MVLLLRIIAVRYKKNICRFFNLLFQIPYLCWYFFQFITGKIELHQSSDETQAHGKRHEIVISQVKAA